MKCRMESLSNAAISLAGLLGLFSVTCHESLPAYKFPDRVLSLQVTLVEQLNDRVAPPGRQVVHIQLTGENIYTDVFQDSVDVKGSIRIWWKRNPTRYRTIYLSEKNFSNRAMIQDARLTLLPGQQFTLDAFWNLKDDDSVYIPDVDRIYQPIHECAANVGCGDPETFVIETSVSIYDRLGFVLAPAIEFPFVKRECLRCGLPPCPPPPGGCG